MRTILWGLRDEADVEMSPSRLPFLIRWALTAVALLLAVGCTVRPTNQGHLWQHGPDSFVTAHCPYFKTCTRVMTAHEPPGDEAYSFVYMVKHMTVIGIPYGEDPVTVYKLGDKDACMKEINLWPKLHDPPKLSADPADRCRGPFWIRR